MCNSYKHLYVAGSCASLAWLLIEKVVSGESSHNMMIFVVCTRFNTAMPVETKPC
jgi:hypothetical protein